jgi:maltooligosyltrehalose synthase
VGTTIKIRFRGSSHCPLWSSAQVQAVRLPTSTYRFQFNYRFTLEKAGALIEYLSDLGISDCYASPLTLARPGSLHGCDVTDHTALSGDRERGTVG